MITKELKRLPKGAKLLGTGYKAIKYDLSTKGDSTFRYGNKGDNLVGKIFTVDGDIKECKWGLHYSKNPLYVFKFYEMLTYNRYFKVESYDKELDDKENGKTVSQTLKFVKEYSFREFIEEIKSKATNRSKATNGSAATNKSEATNRSEATNWSEATNGSEATNKSEATNRSEATNWSEATNGSKATNRSKATNGSYATNKSYATNWSYGIRNGCGVHKSIFCYDFTGKFGLFNKIVSEDRIDEVMKKIKSFNYVPSWNNFYEIKEECKEWFYFNFEEIMEVNNKTAWSKMPKEMLEYIKSLPEYDDDIFNKIIGD